MELLLNLAWLAIAVASVHLPQTTTVGVSGTKTKAFRMNLRRRFTICLAIGAGIAALFGLVMIVSAASGTNSASNILLGGAGLLILIVSVLAGSSAVVSLRSSKLDAKD